MNTIITFLNRQADQRTVFWKAFMTIVLLPIAILMMLYMEPIKNWGNGFAEVFGEWWKVMKQTTRPEDKVEEDI